MTIPNAWVQGVELPDLPDNARYLHHPNQCYDWGTFGWVLKTEDIDTAKYKHFIFLNSSVRGPFLPPYLKVRPVPPRVCGGVGYDVDGVARAL